MRKDQRPFTIIRLKISGDHSEVCERRIVDTQKACINVDHTDEKLGTAYGGRSLARFVPSNL